MMKGKLNVLITAASRRVALIRGFRDAIAKLELKGLVITTDINPLSPGLYVSDKHYFTPLTTNPQYLDRLEEICSKEKVGAIIPTIDDELEIMGKARERFDKLGVKIVVSPWRTSEICNDKLQTFRFFSERGIPTPQTWLPSELPAPTKIKFPLFLKPRRGRGSVGTYPLRSANELLFFTRYIRDPIVQQFLEGPEYTLDTFADHDGRIVAVVPRRRLWIRSGVMDKGCTERKQELIDIGVRVAKELGIIGPANIQVKYSNGKPYVFEVNPRFSGGIPLTLAAGVDFCEMTLRMVLGERLEERLGEFQDGLVMMSYEDSIFLKIDTEGYDKIKRMLT
jgi:carbamoyl-phosphate synthase large subunit